jgi:WD40 repeat protein
VEEGERRCRLARARRRPALRTFQADLRILQGHSGGVRSLCATKVDGRLLLASGGGEGSVRLWDMASGEAVATLEAGAGGLTTMCAVAVGGQDLVAAAYLGHRFDDDATVQLWDPATRSIVASVRTREITSMCGLQVGARVLVVLGSYDGLRLWDVANRRAEPMGSHTGSASSVCVLNVSDRTLVASGGRDRIVRLWDPATGQGRGALEGHRARVTSMCSLEIGGGALLASGSLDGTVRLWRPLESRSVPVRHQVFALAGVDGALAVGLGAGLLVLDIPSNASA